MILTALAKIAKYARQVETDDLIFEAARDIQLKNGAGKASIGCQKSLQLSRKNYSLLEPPAPGAH